MSAAVDQLLTRACGHAELWKPLCATCRAAVEASPCDECLVEDSDLPECLECDDIFDAVDDAATVAARESADEALGAIFLLLDGRAWTPDTLSSVADVLRAVGYTIQPPVDDGDGPCPECERSHGPHFRGRCDHGEGR